MNTRIDNGGKGGRLTKQLAKRALYEQVRQEIHSGVQRPQMESTKATATQLIMQRRDEYKAKKQARYDKALKKAKDKFEAVRKYREDRAAKRTAQATTAEATTLI